MDTSSPAVHDHINFTAIILSNTATVLSPSLVVSPFWSRDCCNGDGDDADLMMTRTMTVLIMFLDGAHDVALAIW